MKCLKSVAWVLVPWISLVGCSGSDDHDHDTSPTPTVSPDATPTATPAASGPQAVEIQFAALVGDEPFACGSTYEGLGSTSTTFTPWDLRFYVYDVQLVTGAGVAVPVALDQDGIWQVETLAMLDFEDKSGDCSDGTTQVNTTIRGSVDAGTYTGIRFGVGVPFEYNHQDATLAPSPLNVTAMFWSWNSGYKFIRLDGATTGMSTGMYFHLGSTNCNKNESGVVTDCDHPNRVEVSLNDFDATTQTVVLDVAALFEGTNMDQNQESTAPLCMSEAEDVDCEASFLNLGLPFGQTSGDPSSQSVFRVE